MTATRPSNDDHSDYITTNDLLQHLSALAFPDLSDAEKKEIKSIYKHVKDQKAKTAPPASDVYPSSQELQESYELNKDKLPDITPEKFADFIKVMQASELVVQYYKQVGIAIRQQVGDKFGMDEYMSVSHILFSKKDPSLLQKLGESSEKLSGSLEDLGIRVSRDQPYWLITLNGIASLKSNEAEAEKGADPDELLEGQEKLTKAEKEAKPEERLAAKEIEGRDQAEEQKKELIQHLQEMAKVYQNLKDGKGEHTGKIQALIRRVKDAPSYDAALGVVEGAVLEQKKRYEQGRAFSFLRKVGVYKLFKSKLNFETELKKEGNSFFFPKLLLQVVKREHQKHPDKAHPELRDLAKGIKPHVHEHYEPTLAWFPPKKQDQEKMAELVDKITQTPEQQPDGMRQEAEFKRANPAEAKIIAYRLAMGHDSVENVIKKIFPNLKQELENAVKGENVREYSGENTKGASGFYLRDSEFDKVLNKLFAKGIDSAMQEIGERRKARLGVSNLRPEADDIRTVLNAALQMKDDIDSLLKEGPQEKNRASLRPKL